MGPNVSYNAVFFTGIAVMLFMSSISNAHSSTSGNDDSALQEAPSIKSFPNKVNPECGPLVKSVSITTLPDILSLDIFAQADPLQYLLEKMTKIGISRHNIISIKGELNYSLGTKRLPLCYIPYTNVLMSLLQCWSHLLSLDKYIRRIQILHPTNELRFESLPVEIASSNELSKLFSSDVIFDSELPLRLFNKLLRMPNDEMMNLKIQLNDFLQKWMPKYKNLPFSSDYVWYVQIMFKFLRDKSALDSLKRNLAEIQRTSRFNEGTTDI